MRDMKPAADIVVMGHFSGLYGVRGWLRVHSYSQTPADILRYKRWHLRKTSDGGEDAPWAAFDCVQARPQGKGLVAQVAPADGNPIDDRDEAAAWVGAQIGIARSDLPRPKGDEVYLADLLGLAVANTSEQALGRIVNILETGAHPVLEIDHEDQPLLIPFVREVYVLEIDLEQGRLLVDWEADY